MPYIDPQRSSSVYSLQGLSMMRPNDAPVIVILGPSGSGKSAFIQNLMPENDRDSASITHGLESEDLSVHGCKGVIGGRDVILLDTPGLELDSPDVFQEIADWKSKNNTKYVDGVILLFPMVQGRLPERMRSGYMMQKLDKMFGQNRDDLYSGLALVTTRWFDGPNLGNGGPEPQLVKARKKEIQEHFGWSAGEQKGAFFRNYDDTVACAEKIVEMVLQTPPVVLVLGPSGAGRSSFIKHLFDAKTAIPVEDRLTPVTTHVQPYRVIAGNKRTVLVDTPGIDDPGKTFRLITQWMEGRKPKMKTIDGIIFFLPIDKSQGDIGDYMHRNLIKPALGKLLNMSRDRYAHLMFVTALRSDGPSPSYPWSEDHIRNQLGGLKDLGAKIGRYNNTLAGAEQVLDELIKPA